MRCVIAMSRDMEIELQPDLLADYLDSQRVRFSEREGVPLPSDAPWVRDVELYAHFDQVAYVLSWEA